MASYSMPQKSPGTMIQMIPFRFNQRLGYKVCLPLSCFRPQLIFLSDQVGQCSRPIRATAGTRLAQAIAAEKLDEYGVSCRRFVLPRDAKASGKRKRPTTDESRGNAIDTDTEDKTFAISVSEGGCSDDSPDLDSDDIEIGNKEV
jgi:hypothetical protein